MKITCKGNAMAVKARICSHRDFAAVRASITENNGVRLPWDRKESKIKYMLFQGMLGPVVELELVNPLDKVLDFFLFFTFLLEKRF